MTNLIVSSALHVAPFLLAGILALTFAAPAYASVTCETRVNDIPDIVVPGASGVKFVGSTAGKDGWDGQGGQCTKAGSDRIWVGPRNADGICLTPASIVGTADGVITKPYKLPDTVIVTPDDPEYRIGLYIDPPGPKPAFWAGTPWIDGLPPAACSH